MIELNCTEKAKQLQQLALKKELNGAPNERYEFK